MYEREGRVLPVTHEDRWHYAIPTQNQMIWRFSGAVVTSEDMARLHTCGRGRGVEFILTTHTGDAHVCQSSQQWQTQQWSGQRGGKNALSSGSFKEVFLV